MKHIFIDTNVIIDLILDREGADNVGKIFQLTKNNDIKLSVSILTMANTAYIIRKSLTREQLYEALTVLSEILTILPMTETQFVKSIMQQSPDFEDMLQYQCAKENNCDMIITRNLKHFAFAEMPVLTPVKFLEQRDYQ